MRYWKREKADDYIQNDKKSDTALAILGALLIGSLIVGGVYSYTESHTTVADNATTTR